MRSHLLEGRVRHRRAGPPAYALDHAVWYAALDVDELDAVDRRLRLFSRNRRNAAVFRDADHLPEPATDIAADVRRHLAGEGIDPGAWRITLVTNLRVLGYVFNPASFFLCRDAAGDLRVVVVEVHNTHGERHLYTLRPSDPADPDFRASMDKTFYVSPFLGMDGRYSVLVRDAQDGLTVAINERSGAGPVLTTNLVLRRRPLTDQTLLGMLVRHPFVTQRTIGLIHWHALRLWLRGARFHRHGDAGREAAEAGSSAGSSAGSPAGPSAGTPAREAVR